MTERPTHAAVQAQAPSVIPEKNMKAEKKVEERKKEEKEGEKLDDKKIKVEKKLKRNEAKVNGRNLSMSTKEAVAVCNFIRNKDVDRAIGDLELVTKYKRAVPMRGEVPHRHGNMMAGRYPIKTVQQFIMLVKSLKSNALLNELELERFKIACMAHQASRPYKRFGAGRIKRSNVQMKLILRTPMMVDGGVK